MNSNTEKSLEHNGTQATLFPEEAVVKVMDAGTAEEIANVQLKGAFKPTSWQRSAKRDLAAELNWKKARMLPAYALLLSHTPAHLKPQLGYVFKACLETLQKQADKAGIKGDYTKYIPHEQTAAYKRALKKYEKEQAKAASNEAGK
jgi:hypothetical protein